MMLTIPAAHVFIVVDVRGVQARCRGEYVHRLEWRERLMRWASSSEYPEEHIREPRGSGMCACIALNT
eukprot:4910002-Alexandrium_andersonii.AAC.1